MKGKVILMSLIVLASVTVILAGSACDAVDSEAMEGQNVAYVGDTGYATVSEAISSIQTEGRIILMSDIQESITIPAGKTITLDLNGNNMTEFGTSHNIINNGTLTINDSVGTGTITNSSAGKSVLQNEPGAVATINGGTLSKIRAIDSSDYYVITNHGELITINGGTIYSASNNSSAIENGWYTPSQNTSGEYSRMVINGGSISSPSPTATGGLYTVKNDDYGIMEINGGTFTNSTAGAGSVLNWNKLTINGGTFNATSASVVTLATGTSPNDIKYDYEVGTTEIYGGIFNAPVITFTGYPAITITIYGGQFSTNPHEEYIADGYACVKSEDVYIVSEVCYSTDDVSDQQDAIIDLEDRTSANVELLVGSINISSTDGIALGKVYLSVSDVSHQIEVPEGSVATFDIKITVENDSEYSADITVPITVPVGQMPVMYYINDDGDLVPVEVVTYTSSSVTFRTTHNTLFTAMLEDNPIISDDDEALPPFVPQQPSGDDDTTIYVACCAAAAVVALLAVVIVMMERKK